MIYIQRISDDSIKFLCGKYRIIAKQLSSKSIPCLELKAVCLGTETLLDLLTELTGEKCVIPLNVVSLELFTDSLVCLNWLQSHASKFSKIKFSCKID